LVRAKELYYWMKEKEKENGTEYSQKRRKKEEGK